MKAWRNTTVLVVLFLGAWPICFASAGDSIFQHIDPDAEMSNLVSAFLNSHRVKRYGIVTVDVQTIRETITEFEHPSREESCCVLHFQVLPDIEVALPTYRVNAEWLKPWHWIGVDFVTGVESPIASLTVDFGDRVTGRFYGLGGRIRIEPLDRRGTHIVWESEPFDRSIDDEEILETVRASATEIYMEQASWTLPESFHNSGLAPSDKKRLVEQWANASATCLVDALSEYANATNVPLSELVAEDGSFALKGGSDSEFDLNLSSCIERAWEAVGANLEY